MKSVCFQCRKYKECIATKIEKADERFSTSFNPPTVPAVESVCKSCRKTITPKSELFELLFKGL